MTRGDGGKLKVHTTRKKEREKRRAAGGGRRDNIRKHTQESDGRGGGEREREREKRNERKAQKGANGRVDVRWFDGLTSASGVTYGTVFGSWRRGCTSDGGCQIAI